MAQGPCPKCNGTAKLPAPDCLSRQAPDGTIPCDNCGGQTMGGVATGQVNLRADGSPCLHEVVGEKRGNCYYWYTCKHCGYSFDIDSGD